MIAVISKLLISVSLSLTHIYFAFISWIHFAPCLSTFSEFSFQSNKHSKDLYLILETKVCKINSICGLLLLSRALLGSIETTVPKLLIYSSVCIRTVKIS